MSDDQNYKMVNFTSYLRNEEKCKEMEEGKYYFNNIYKTEVYKS